jgi:hypothetical protein
MFADAVAGVEKANTDPATIARDDTTSARRRLNIVFSF